MKGEGLQGGGWGQDVTASFLHLFGNLRGIGGLRHNKTLERLQKKRIQRSAASAGTAGSPWHRAPLDRRGSHSCPAACANIAVCVCSTRRGSGQDSWQGLCSCRGDVGGVWELAMLAAVLGKVTPISAVRSWSRS